MVAEVRMKWKGYSSGWGGIAGFDEADEFWRSENEGVYPRA